MIPESTADTASATPFLYAIHQLSLILREETEALSRDDLTNLQSYNTRKSQALLNLSRIEADGIPELVIPDIRQEADRVISALQANQQQLMRHLHAVREIAGVIAAAILQCDSDGTYNRFGQTSLNAS